MAVVSTVYTYLSAPTTHHWWASGYMYCITGRPWGLGKNGGACYHCLGRGLDNAANDVSLWAHGKCVPAGM